MSVPRGLNYVMDFFKFFINQSTLGNMWFNVIAWPPAGTKANCTLTEKQKTVNY